MKKEKKIELQKEDFGIIAICAIRYCQGRETYMPDLIREKIRPHLTEIHDRDLRIMIEDCDSQRRCGLYGDEKIDKPGWLKWEQELKAEWERRTHEEKQG